ncbi:MAG: chorismate mutase [Clostridiaceae bacterium]|nr:chorismate mutase [Clostridiaceae bacterium]
MIEAYRAKLDAIDNKIAELYRTRMELARVIGLYKANNDLQAFDAAREKEIINRVTKEFPTELKAYAKQLFDTLIETSKAYQSRFLKPDLDELLENTLKSADKPFPVSASVACQGVEGSFSSIAAEKLFTISDITYFKNFESVFNAVEKGLCEYGVLPIENSTVGSVNEVYDLMKRHRFYIVRSLRLPVAHSLLAKRGTELKDVKEIFSHEQAINQCSEYLTKLGSKVKVTVCENTAAAARAVADSKRKDVAAIASENCCSLYSLSALARGVQNKERNYTRFICISKNPEIFERADKVSIMVSLPHESGSLNRLLNKFSVLGLNLTKLESRPLESSEFEFMFYFDFDADLRKPEVRNLIAELSVTLPQFIFLGCYSEKM